MVKEEKHSRHFNVLFARVMQILAGCGYFLYVFGVFDGKLGIELITCLKLRNNVRIPKLAVMEKVTLKSNAETYN